MTTWFTSDIHFGHKNIIKFCPDTRKYENADQMDQAIIQNWNRQVADDDVVYVLGDVFFHRPDRALNILRQLRGRKRLVLGNHDEVIVNNPDIAAEFESVDNYLTIKMDGIHVVLFHFPIFEWDKMHYGSYHLYGHVHGKVQVPGRAMDVGIDTRQDNCLWSWEEIHKQLKDRELRTHH